jgi:hypothetical protein
MRLAKAVGLITKFPGGRKPRRSAPRSKDRIIARAQGAIEREIMARKSVSASAAAGLPAKPWDELTKAEKLAANVDLGLDIVRRILELGVDASDPKVLGHVKDTALTAISQLIRINEGQLRSATAEEQRREQVLAELAKGLGATRWPVWRKAVRARGRRCHGADAGGCRKGRKE